MGEDPDIEILKENERNNATYDETEKRKHRKRD
jgi:hypothetical protein